VTNDAHKFFMLERNLLLECCNLVISSMDGTDEINLYLAKFCKDKLDSSKIIKQLNANLNWEKEFHEILMTDHFSREALCNSL